MLANNIACASVHAHVYICMCVCEGKKKAEEGREREGGTCGSNLVVLLSGSGGESVGQRLRAVWIVSEAAGVRLPSQTLC